MVLIPLQEQLELTEVHQQHKVIIMKQSKCVMLDEDSFFSWRAQFSALLRGYHLLDYVEDKVEITPGSAKERQTKLFLAGSLWHSHHLFCHESLLLHHLPKYGND